MTYFLIIAGFALLLFGGEAVVRGSVALAQRLGVSPLIVGLTIVGFGTSLPEMVVSVNAALVGSPGLAVGNVVGSNIANILLILGVAAIIAPIAVHPDAVRRDMIGMATVTLIYVVLGMTGQIVLWQGVLMLVALAAYIGFTVWHDNKTNDAVAELHRDEAAEMGVIPLRTVSIAGIIVTGLFAVVVGAEWLVTGATSLATAFGVPDEVIGLTIVAFGTSLPELATSIVAAYRGHADVCVGNVLGSNLFNLLVLGLDDVFYRQGPLLSQVDASHSVTIFAIVTMNALFLIGLTYRVMTKRFAVTWDTGAIAVVYVAAIGLTYLLRG